MQMDQKTYQKYVEKRAKKSNLGADTARAYLVGGGICVLGQGLYDCYLAIGMTEKDAKTLLPVSLIFLSALLTALNVFDKIAKFAGAGTLVPITGFANAVVSPAIDTKAEGFILGVGAKIFTIAGPVILYGTLASTIYGVILWIGRLL
ncbi:MAG: SpoVA/SpoVAEb family sporulation membrane protein [Ruminococcaceae bacterium]|nr:SpoVA/SpoVAEb family sporulation membrane protein [Oscillospiraceae bacterium]